MTTADKLNKLLTTKQEIKNAIENKGVNVGDAPFAEYADKIEEIEEGMNIQDGALVQETDGVVTAYIYSSNGITKRLIDEAYCIEDIVLVDDITEISTRAFSGMNNLENFDFREPLKIIGYGSFQNSSNLKMPDELPITVESIGTFAFRFCTFKKLHAKGLRSLGGYALGNNDNLESVKLGSEGNPVESINVNAMRNCPNLTNITLYVDNPSEGLPDAPWGATNATVTYLQA